MITIKSLKKTFGQDTLFKEFTLKIPKGQFLAIVGPSGTGKSTLLNLIAGLDKPTTGEILISNKKINLLSDQEISQYRNKNIGFIFQEFHLHPELTVKENILMPTHFGKHKTYDINLLLKEVGLTNKKNSKTKTLSGGQKQRVAIARALIHKPKIILADEPTGNLDQKTAKQIKELLQKIHKTHKITLIIATHDQTIAKSADKIINIK